VSVLSQPPTLNPLYLSGRWLETIRVLAFSSLLATDPRGRLIPDAAERVPSMKNGLISRDGLTIRYRLRKGIMWQDGAPLTARDVVFTFRAIRNSHNSVPSRMGVNHIAWLRSSGRRDVVLRLNRPYAPILSTFFGPDGYPILPWHLLHSFPSLDRARFGSKPIGSGPYRIVDWIHGQRIDLTANVRYFGAKPSVQKIRIEDYPSIETAQLALQTHQIDADFNIDSANISSGNLGSFRVKREPSGSIVMLAMNASDPALRSPLIRQALMEGIDRSALIRIFRIDGIEPDAQELLPESAFYDRRIAPQPYDPVRAARMIRSVTQGRRLRLRLAYSDLVPDADRIAVVLSDQLGRIGIRLRLRRYQPELFFGAAPQGVVFGGHYQLALVPLIPAFDPDNSEIFGCSKIAPLGLNFSRICDPQLDGLMYEAARTYDTYRRAALYAAVARRLNADVPGIFLWEPSSVVAYQNNLSGVEPSAFSSIFWNANTWKL